MASPIVASLGVSVCLLAHHEGGWFLVLLGALLALGIAAWGDAPQWRSR